MDGHQQRQEEEWSRRLREWEQDATTQGWDTPRLSSWDRLAEELPTAPNKRRWLPFLWIVGLALLVAVPTSERLLLQLSIPPYSPETLMQYPQVGAEQTTSPVDEDTDRLLLDLVDTQYEETATLEGVDGAATTNEYESIAKENQLGTPSTLSTSEASIEMEAENLAVAQKEQPALNSNHAASTPTLESAENQVKRSEEEIVFAQDEPNTEEALAGNLPLPQLDPLPALPIAGIAAPIENDLSTIANTNNKPVENLSTLPSRMALLASVPMAFPEQAFIVPGQPSGWYVGGHLSWKDGVSVRRPTYRRLLSEERGGTEFGGFVGRELGRRWRLEVGYEQRTYEFREETTFARLFDPGTETTQGAEKVSTYTLNVFETPTTGDAGGVEVKLSRRPNQPILTGERVLMQLDTRERQRYRNVPVRLGYEILTVGQVQLVGLAGLSWESINVGIQAERVAVVDPRFERAEILVNSRTREKNINRWNAIAGLRIEAHVLGKATLFAQPSMNWSLGETNLSRIEQNPFSMRLGAFWKF